MKTVVHRGMREQQGSTRRSSGVFRATALGILLVVVCLLTIAAASARSTPGKRILLASGVYQSSPGGTRYWGIELRKVGTFYWPALRGGVYGGHDRPGVWLWF